MTVDEQVDFDVIEKLINALGLDRTWLEYVQYMLDHNLTAINSDIIRNEGFLKSLKND